MDTTDEHSSTGATAWHRRGIRVRKAVLTTALAVAGLIVSTYYGGLLGNRATRGSPTGSWPAAAPWSSWCSR
jgi:hypothetical protein